MGNIFDNLLGESFETIMFTLVFVFILLMFIGVQQSNDNMTASVIGADQAEIEKPIFYNKCLILAMVIFIILLIMFAVHLYREFS